MGLSAEWHNVLLNLKVTGHFIDLDTEDKILSKRIMQKNVKRISVRAAVR